MTIITPISWSSLSIQINSMLIGTNTKLQLQQLNNYGFVLRGYKCTRCKSICGVRDQRHGQQCLDQTVWHHLQVWIWMLNWGENCHWKLQDSNWQKDKAATLAIEQLFFRFWGYNCICCDLTFVEISILPYILCNCKSQNERITVQLQLFRLC